MFDCALSRNVRQRARIVQSAQQKTGNRIRYKKVDAETEEEVESADIIKGYQVDKNVYVTVEDEEIEALQIESSHTIEIDKFVPADQIDSRFRQPYYIVQTIRSARTPSPSYAMQ